jgi:hypothetical protein
MMVATKPQRSGQSYHMTPSPALSLESAPGDSGAIVVNSQGRTIGSLLTGFWHHSFHQHLLRYAYWLPAEEHQSQQLPQCSPQPGLGAIINVC